MVNKIFFLFLCSGLLTEVFDAQTTTWTLKQCVDQALEKNVALNQNKLASDVNYIAVEQSKANLLPNLNATDVQSFYFGRSLDPVSYQYTNQHISTNSPALVSTVNLFNGFQYLNTIRQNNYFYDAGVQDIERMKNDITLLVLAAYVQVLVGYEAVDIAENQVQASSINVTRAEIFVKAGKQAEGALFQMQAQLAADKLTRVNAQNDLQLAKISLLQLMETPVFAGFEIERPDIKTVQPSLDIPGVSDIYQIAEGIMPQVKVSACSTKAFVAGYKVAESLFLPRLSLTGTLKTGYSSFAGRVSEGTSFQQQPIGFLQSNPSDQVIGFVPVTTITKSDYPISNQFSDNFGQILGFNLTIPIFNNFQAKYTTQKAKIGIATAQLNEQATKNALRKSVEQAYTDLVGAGNKYLATQEQLRSETCAYTDMEKKFSNGMNSATDYLVEKNNYLKAEQTLVQAKYDYLFKSKVIDFFSGKPITL